MRSEKGTLRCWAVLTLVIGCLGTAAVFTLPAYVHDIIGWGAQAVDSSDFPITNAVAISGGTGHSLALDVNGFIFTWG